MDTQISFSQLEAVQHFITQVLPLCDVTFSARQNFRHSGTLTIGEHEIGRFTIEELVTLQSFIKE